MALITPVAITTQINNHKTMTNDTTIQSAAKVRLYGLPNSAEAYEIRDFLNRSVVEFDWIELTNDQDCDRELGFSALSDLRLPMVEFPDGTQLFSPSIREIAQRLGWVTQPKFREYDLSIYGAGPAGLSAAVYAASEGLRTVLIERHAVGGQAGTSSLIENYMGFPKGIRGADLAERARQQTRSRSLMPSWFIRMSQKHSLLGKAINWRWECGYGNTVKP